MRKKPGEVVPCTTESKPCDTRVYCVWTEKKLNPLDNEHLVNPYINFNEHRSTGPSYPSTSLTSPTTSASDISTLIQVCCCCSNLYSFLCVGNSKSNPIGAFIYIYKKILKYSWTNFFLILFFFLFIF